MAELLSREKEFIKLNKELDQLAVTSTDQQTQRHQQLQHQHQHPLCNSVADSGSGGSGAGTISGSGVYSGLSKQLSNKQEQRYFTYTKSKGPSTLLKKRANGIGAGGVAGGGNGAGDGNCDRLAELPTERNNTHRMTRKVTQQSSTSTAPSMRPDGDSILAAHSETPRTNRTSSTMHRKHINSPDSGARTYGRASNCSSRTKEAAGFTVKYRNPKFVQSPSLEVLIRDEGAALRAKGSSELGDSGCSSRRSMDTTGKKQISTEGLIKFLKSKIAIIEEDHERISQEMSNQKEMLDKTLERNKKLEQQRDQAFSKHNAIAEQLNKTENQLEEVNRRIKERSIEQNAQQKELEAARRELKVLAQTNTNLEKRLYRANEELENTKSALALLKNAERELKESMRVDDEKKDKQIKSLKKQRADLLNAYKKQLFLIDNLKRQNICMEQSKMISFGEKEFTKVLEWNTKL
ncbi:PREDICTED: testis-expressed sequence 9 protein [Rhagoletis zephyria]|uniref:testis-expressed sequence 9 protein n=1 Tax=Rhagoletis zephyria TaxID=28612 RepID=UPI0008113842|nr:PREDICTED: testis-expressed sequence 9 protein [Rhagoletis zephyria]